MKGEINKDKNKKQKKNWQKIKLTKPKPGSLNRDKQRTKQGN